MGNVKRLGTPTVNTTALRKSNHHQEETRRQHPIISRDGNIDLALPTTTTTMTIEHSQRAVTSPTETSDITMDTWLKKPQQSTTAQALFVGPGVMSAVQSESVSTIGLGHPEDDVKNCGSGVVSPLTNKMKSLEEHLALQPPPPPPPAPPLNESSDLRQQLQTSNGFHYNFDYDNHRRNIQIPMGQDNGNKQHDNLGRDGNDRGPFSSWKDIGE